MDKDNQILKLIHEGSKLEVDGKIEKANELFLKAWEEASNHLEKCIAAHFVARNQKTPEESLKWNEKALEEANLADKYQVIGYYPSLYVNLGISHENLGNIDEAKKFYDLAFDKIPDLPTDEPNKKYSKGVKDTIILRREKLK